MVELTLKKRHTYDDYLKTPDDTRYELIGGKLIMAPAPVPEHQRILIRLASIILKFATEHNLGEVFIAPCDIYLDNENVVQPDILFISKGRIDIIGEKNIRGAPDFVIEIISENTAYRDAIQKKRLYEKFGVKEYWILAPQDRMVEVYSLKEGEYQLIKTFIDKDTIECQIIKGFKVDLGEVFV